MFTGTQYVGYCRGTGYILDSSLNVVQSVQAQGGLTPIDQHEFNVLESNSALVTIYAPQQYDLSADGIVGGLGWIMNCWFQEVELGTNKLLFEWSALEHVPTSYSTIIPDSTDSSGNGLDPTEPWDYFHINSIDKFTDGNYLISARHTSTIYKISSQNGTILWQLGGKSSDFALIGGMNFSYQHDARFRYQNSTTTILSLFDNAADGYNKQSSAYSSGIIIAIDHVNATASLVQRFIAPGEMISSSQGNVQLLDPSNWETSNVYTSWGENAYIAEYTSDGTMVQQGHFATTGSMHYRSRKSNFTITPTDAPAVYAYALNSSTPTVYYISWNGATETAQWRIYTGSSGNITSGGFTELVTVPKVGFETTYTAQGYQQYSIIEALDTSGKGLRNTTRVVQTFVPSQLLASSCDKSGCAAASGYGAGGPSIASGQVPMGSPTIDARATATATKNSVGGSTVGAASWLVLAGMLVLLV